jgi:hypothetical protein
MKIATKGFKSSDGQLIEMVEVNGIWTPLWMAEEMAAGRMSDRAGHEFEVMRVNGAIPLTSGAERSGFKEPKLLTSGDLGESRGDFESDGRAARN